MYEMMLMLFGKQGRPSLALVLALLLVTCCSCRTLGLDPGRSGKNPTGERLVWFSTYANLSRLKDAAAIEECFTKCRDAGLTAVVMDIEVYGCLTYPSELGPHFSTVEDFPFQPDFDLIQTSVDIAHKLGLKCLVSYFGTHAHPLDDDWRLVDIDGSKQEKSVNPFLPEVKERYFSIAREILERYDVDGLLLDGIRFRSFRDDFSEWARKGFEEFLGHPVGNWPTDIVSFCPNSAGKEKMVRGPLFKEWAEFRAGVVRDYFEDMRELVNSIRPDVWFADYVGAWYPTYAAVGVNWASSRFHAGYEWMTDGYHKTGYAQVLDFLAVGLYYEHVTLDEVRATPRRDFYSIEGGADLSNKVVAKAAPVFGTLYVLKYINDPETFIRAVKMADAKTDGVVIFDAVYIAEWDWWDELACALNPECVSLEEEAGPQ